MLKCFTVVVSRREIKLNVLIFKTHLFHLPSLELISSPLVLAGCVCDISAVGD